MNIGIIGTGNMGTILVESFIESRAVTPSNLFITNRTIEKADKLKAIYPELQIATTIEDVVTNTDIIFICIKPLDIFPLLKQISPLLKRNQCIVSITSPISVEQIAGVVNCNVARIIPSITNTSLSGISLITLSEDCSHDVQLYLNSLLNKISTPILIPDNVTRVASDIVSCGPAFFSYIVQRFIKSAVEETEINDRLATELASGMLIGLGKLLEKGVYTLPTLQEKVIVKGGVTGEGIKVLEEELGDIFNHVFLKTHKKYYEDMKEVREQFEFTNKP